MEITSFTGALAGIKHATDLAKIIRDSSSSLEKAEINLKLAELISALADAKIEVANIREVVSEKDNVIRELKEKLEISGNLVWETPYYFLVNEGEKDGPFCQKCYDSKKSLIRLQCPGREGYWECKECDNDYQDSNYKSIGPVSIPKRGGVDWSGY